jgi:hypothetical protein
MLVLAVRVVVAVTVMRVVAVVVSLVLLVARAVARGGLDAVVMAVGWW